LEEIDVVILTKNSARTIRRCLDSLHSLFKPHCLIVVDGGSSDETLSLVDKEGARLIQAPSLRVGKARQVGIEATDTEWFMFLDSDVYLERLPPQLSSHLNDDGCGLIDWVPKEPHPFMAWREATMRLSLFPRRRKPPSGHTLARRSRAFTGNAFIRKSAVLGINLPNISAFEDWLIQRYIETNGSGWVRLEDAQFSYHDFEANVEAHHVLESGAYAVMLGFEALRRVLFRFAYFIPRSLLLLGYVGSVRIWLYFVKLQIRYTAGALKGWFASK
jgi:glycosyltransferase involved in cell wall biosynthesis